MSATVWLWIGLGVLAFALGFFLSWLQMRRRLQRRVNEVVAEEVSRRVQERVLNELRGGSTPDSGESASEDRKQGKQDDE